VNIDIGKGNIDPALVRKDSSPKWSNVECRCVVGNIAKFSSKFYSLFSSEKMEDKSRFNKVTAEVRDTVRTQYRFCESAFGIAIVYSMRVNSWWTVCTVGRECTCSRVVSDSNIAMHCTFLLHVGRPIYILQYALVAALTIVHNISHCRAKFNFRNHCKKMLLSSGNPSRYIGLVEDGEFSNPGDDAWCALLIKYGIIDGVYRIWYPRKTDAKVINLVAESRPWKVIYKTQTNRKIKYRQWQ